VSDERIRYDIFAYFPCNSGGVRVGVRYSDVSARRYAERFSKRNNGVRVGFRAVLEPKPKRGNRK
jgi:hypothetical protein